MPLDVLSSVRMDFIVGSKLMGEPSVGSGKPGRPAISLHGFLVWSLMKVTLLTCTVAWDLGTWLSTKEDVETRQNHRKWYEQHFHRGFS